MIQIGEFSLAILELARSSDMIPAVHSQVLIITIVISMILTPILLKNLSSLAATLLPEDTMEICNATYVDKDTKGHIVVLGYGHLGQEIVKKLKRDGQEYIIVEHNMKYFQIGLDHQEPIIFGNAASKHILTAVSIKTACAIIVAIENPDKLNLICEIIDDLTHNTRTVVKVTQHAEKAALEGLHIEHIVVSDDVLAQSLVDETKFCKITLF